MADQLVRVEIAAPIARVTLDDPPMNPVSAPTLDALAAFARVQADRKVRVVILTGAGERAFCVGADLPRLWPAHRGENRNLSAPDHRNGYCIGGGTAIAWSCDYRIAADNTAFRAGDAHLGIVPSCGMGLACPVSWGRSTSAHWRKLRGPRRPTL